MTFFKKIAAIAAVILVLFCVFGPVFAAEQSELSVGVVYIPPSGSQGGLKLTLESLPQIDQGRYLTCVRFKLRYDPSAFSVPTASGYTVEPSASDFSDLLEDRLVFIPGVELRRGCERRHRQYAFEKIPSVHDRPSSFKHIPISCRKPVCQGAHRCFL